MRLLPATICLILIVSEYGILRGEEMKPIAVGHWSEWNDGLRGRLLLSEGRICSPDGKTRETLVYAELENRIDSGRLLEVYFDPNNLKCELLDADREAVPDDQIPISRIRQGKPAKCWVTPILSINRQMCRLYLSLMDRIGVRLDRFGDADEPLQEI